MRFYRFFMSPKIRFESLSMLKAYGSTVNIALILIQRTFAILPVYIFACIPTGDSNAFSRRN